MTNKETVDLRAAIIAELEAATDEMKFDLAGNDFAYVANRLLPIIRLTCISQEERIAEAREAFEAIKEYLDRDETQLAWEAANTALTNTGEVR